MVNKTARHIEKSTKKVLTNIKNYWLTKPIGERYEIFRQNPNIRSRKAKAYRNLQDTSGIRARDPEIGKEAEGMKKNQ